MQDHFEKIKISDEDLAESLKLEPPQVPQEQIPEPQSTIPVLDEELMICLLNTNSSIQNFCKATLKDEKLSLRITSVQMSNFLFLTKLGVTQVLLVSLPLMPEFTLTFMLALELLYFYTIVSSYLQH